MRWVIVAFVEIAALVTVSYYITQGLYAFMDLVFKGIFSIFGLDSLLGHEPPKRFSRKWWPVFWRVFVSVCPIAIGIFLIGDGMVAISPWLKRISLWAMNALGVKSMQLLVGLSVLLLGFSAFYFKLKRQISYGAVEVFFAWTAGVIAARQMRPDSDWSGQIATLIGAVYIVSRGLGNIKDGLNAKSAKT
jgi:hypothetical protein